MNPQAVPGEPELSQVAKLIADSSRSTMLWALCSGEALTAGELSRLAGVSASTASAHLSRLAEGGLIEVAASGRRRYFRLASPEVAQALEALSAISPRRPVRSLRHSRRDAALAKARTCYDHLAGRLGVDLYRSMHGRGWLDASADGLEVSPEGERRLDAMGVDVAAARAARRGFARPCLDFTERRSHLAGAVAAALCARFFDADWVRRRSTHGRALRITDAGREGLRRHFDVDLEAG